MRLIDADAYAEEMKKRKDKALEWYEEADKAGNDDGRNSARSAFFAFVEAKLTLDKMPTVDAVQVAKDKNVRSEENPDEC